MAYSRLEQLKIRLRQSDVSNENEDKFLEQLVLQAEQDVRLYRNYPDNYTEEMIEKDMKKFDSIIIDLALYDYNQEGGEFQTSSSENGTSRNWIDRDKILGKVTPFVQIL
ncbi:phage head-tail connector protein [Faecalicatena acetigenes]|uniref:Phage head-tail connector protein n=1 Tax=Faecalicatena acetigenes TaxID=2981790 RepID=A0ABT2TCS5_9FIRM|nr:phage head-tail connector protein [Faecalicatena acetigenes]MCU6748042.1 phage head-tail connector protein [Faecalicatena acetigenes]SCI22871.1 Uncharacterised protein [uncultured Clostridium sp.]